MKKVNQDYVVGLDIGTTKIAVIVGRRGENNTVKILGYGKALSSGVQRGSVINIDRTAAAIKEALDAAQMVCGFDIEIKNVYVGIAGQHIKSRQQKGSVIRENQDLEISKEEVSRFIKNMEKIQVNPGEKIIHVIPQEFIVDGVHGINYEDVVGMSAVTLEANFHIITGMQTSIRNIERSVEKAGLIIEKLVLEPLVSAEAVLDEKDKEAGVVLVDIGGGTTDIAIIHERRLCHTAVIPLAGEIITQDIKEGCSILREQAQVLKEVYGSALPGEIKTDDQISIPALRNKEPKEVSVRNLASIIGARAEEIIEQVIVEIENSGYKNKLIGGVVVTGGGAKLKHLIPLIEYQSGMDARKGLPNEHLSPDNLDELADPIYATGVGLVIYGLERKEAESPSVEAENAVVENEPLVEEKAEETSDLDLVLPVKKKKKTSSLFTDIVGKVEGFFSDIDE